MIAMALYPDVQQKAQEELDRVVGPNRLPEFEDRDDLVYIQAIILEAMRWMVVTPLGVTHCVTADDEYKGFFIPKGAAVIAVSSTPEKCCSNYSPLLCLLEHLVCYFFCPTEIISDTT